VSTLSSDSRPILGRGPALGWRFAFFVVLSIVLMTMDRRSNYLQSGRLWVSTALNPFYSVAQAPLEWWGWLTESLTDRETLRSENERLSRELRVARVRLLQFDALSEENRRLRAIRSASQGIAGRTLIAEIMQVSLDPFRHRVRINQGSENGVFKGQPVLDAFGIIGQVARVDRYGAEVILISDPEHATPVQVNRNGIRSIAVGTGDMSKLSLSFLTVEADIKVDDLLVSSGLDQIFPQGYPVARVTKVERNSAATFAIVEARPLAQLDRAREVVLLWFEQAGTGTGGETPVSVPPAAPAPASSLPTRAPPTPPLTAPPLPTTVAPTKPPTGTP
jgi:rod shape-determining protein MreC